MIRTKNMIHPGEILVEEFLKPMGISQNKLAMDIHVPAPRTGAEFWMNLQSNYDLCIAAALAKKEIDAIQRLELA